MPNFESLLLREENGVLVVTIHRPEAMNALNASVLRSLQSLTDWLESSDEGQNYRALILTGAGEKSFVAGADIKQFESMTKAMAVEFAREGQRIFTRLETLKIPVIGAINGFALGGGLELALACDFIYASDNAKFGLPECTLGLMPGFGGTVRLPRRIGPARAREMTLTGSMISAQEALAIGLVNKVVSQADLITSCLECAKTMTQRAPIALAKIKASIHEGMSLGETQASELEAALFGELFSTEDKVEGVRAFIEKRKAQFKGL
jgi:enoyl-CoA hydratase